MEKIIINLTPHAVKVIADDGSVVLELAKPVEGTTIPRVSVKAEEAFRVNGAIVRKTTFGAVEGLPEKRDGVYLLVSALVRTASGRDDLVSPGELARDSEGKPVGCKGLTI
jgi:hypothetical protein